MSFKQKLCVDLKAVSSVNISETAVCEECEKNGTEWVHLRTCQTCGITLCCDSSPNRHATYHFLQTAHPVIASAEPGERWLWCYEHRLYTEY